MTARALIGLGSNLGDRKAHLDGAIAALGASAGVVVVALSAYRETAPVGGPGGQGGFLNAAAAVETSLDPRALLRVLHAIEDRQGRARSVRWGERTLDLDLLLHGDEVVDSPDLRIPHPRMCIRRFVLAPAAEIAAGALEPLTGRTVGELLANLDRRPSRVGLVGPGSDEIRRRLIAALPAAGHDESERWIVTDFGHADASAGRERFQKARSQILAPTFLAATTARTYWQLRSRREQNPADPPGGRAVPLLWPGAAELLSSVDPAPEAIESMTDEIMTACAATRTG